MTAKSKRPAMYTDWPEHSPCLHFAAQGYQHLLARVDFTGLPEYEDNRQAERRQEESAVLALLLDGWESPPKKRAKKDPAATPPEDKPIKFAGVFLDWHRVLPRLKTWAGQMTLEGIIDARVKAIQAAGELDCPLMDWQQPIGGASGIDPRTVIGALDAGFSLNGLGIKVQTWCAAELLAIVGLQISPITRFARDDYGYQADSRWWSFRISQRPGQDYLRQFFPASERRN